MPPFGRVARTLGVEALLLAALPANAALTAAALLRGLAVPPRRVPATVPATVPKTVLVSGGKMTKALALARAFHAAGHRVILVEAAAYRTTGHRFSRAVDRFYTVPKPDDPGYAQALLAIVRREGVDVYVPVCSPLASRYDALAATLLAPYCEVLSATADEVAMLDDKHALATTARALGLPTPDTHRITSPEQVEDFDFASHPGPYVLKSLAYDPVNRLDLTRLPRPTPAQTRAFVRSKAISTERPWVLQAFVEGRELCTHSTVRDGRVTAWCASESSAFQINYAMVEVPAVEEWVTELVGKLGLTGQVSFDVIEAPDGGVHVIECNPRTHSAITEFHDHPGLAAAYLEPDAAPVRPLPASRPTYWIYHELFRLATQPARLARLRTIARGTDAIFSWSDPLPFFVTHHVHVPWLLARALVQGRDWVRIDLNIGKLVQPAGD